MRKWATWRLVTVVFVATLVATGCPSRGPGQDLLSLRPPAGGKITLGAEQWPECLNPITECGDADIVYWTAVEHVMPRAMQWTLDGLYTNSPLLAEAPTLANGGLTQDPFTVRFKINPKARWADGSAITCADFEFTRNAIVNTRGRSEGLDGYEGLRSIDCRDRRTVVLGFTNIDVRWPEMFGGSRGFVLERAAFPAEADAVTVDLSREMQDGIPFSGGPWKLQSWSTFEAVLVPNPRYWVNNTWGRPTYLDRVTILPATDPIMAWNDLSAGRLDATFPTRDPQGAAPPRSLPSAHIEIKAGPGNSYDALWMDVSEFPFNDRAVRAAFFYAVDRQTVIDAVVNRADHAQAKPLGCGVLAVPGSFWCDQQPFAKFHHDPDMVARILTADGWTKDAQGFWSKRGRELSFVYQYTTYDAQIVTEGIVRANLIASGFNATMLQPPLCLICMPSSGHGVFQVFDFRKRVGPDLSVTGLLACDAIPTAANGYTGDNESHWCDPVANVPLKASDRELDPVRRRALLDQVYAAEAADFAPALPLYVVPNVTAWRTDRLAGPIARWNSTTYGGFFNLAEWSCLRGSVCR
jgi:peptide/nickel transport system substrate-binding protein